MARFEYSLVLLFWLIVSVVIHYRYRIQLYQSVKQMIVSVGFFFIIGFVWDVIGVAREHWYFRYENLIGIRVGVLPLEEILFFLIVPYAILVFYKFFALKID